MNTAETRNRSDGNRRLAWTVILIALFALTGTAIVYLMHGSPRFNRNYGRDTAFNRAMYGPAIEQPIAFSHRLHVTDKKINCRYCHPYPERSLNAGLPPVRKCLGCHNVIIPEHQEIRKLKAYKAAGENVPWIRIMYNPDHVFFPHFRHITREVECRQCHGEIETADQLNQVTVYMGFCLNCHKEMGAPRDCIACHQ